jgi:hypothetical protein
MDGSVAGPRQSPLRLRGWTLGTVQQESTATGLDSGGLMRTFWDGDLHRWTAVEVVPLYGMQEVWGSNLHSSTPGQKCISNNESASGPPAGHSEGQDRLPDGLLTSGCVPIGQRWARL